MGKQFLVCLEPKMVADGGLSILQPTRDVCKQSGCAILTKSWSEQIVCLRQNSMHTLLLFSFYAGQVIVKISKDDARIKVT